MGIIKAGVCVHLASSNKKHLHVVLNDPKPYQNYDATVAVVSLSSTISADKTVVLKVGDHPFVKRDTYVVYAWAKIIDATTLETKVTSDGTVKHNDDCSEDLLARIRQGVFDSRFSKPVIKEYLKA